ncbi:MAG: TetR/AcrR family transcriptional regulator [Bacteroidales bacterium]
MEQNIEKRKTTRQKIMDAAIELFANRGYHTTSVSMVSEKAGISKGLMYNYFDNKEGLLREIVFYGIDRVMESFDPNRDGVLTRDEFIHFIKQSFRLMQLHRNFWKFYYSIIYQPSVMELLGGEVFETYNLYARITTEYFKSQGKDDPETEMKFFTALMDGIALNYLMDPVNFPVVAIEKKVLNMYS